IEYHPQSIDIRAWRCLRLPILLRCCISRRTKGSSILSLPRLKVAYNAKIDQVDMSIRRPHDIVRLEVAKDNRWLLHMQVVQYRTQLDADLHHLLYWQLSL